MLSDERILIRLVGVLLAVFISVISIFVCAKKVPQMEFFTSSVESLDNTKNTVMGLSAAVLGISVGITLLPDDYATPIAETLSDMTKYFIMILGMVFLEKLMVTEGTAIAFTYVIPIACAFWALYWISGRRLLKSWAGKILVLGVAMILVVPVGTHISEAVSAKYITYVEDTISTAKTGTDKLDEISTPVDDDQSVYERLSGLFQTAIAGVKDLFDYFSTIVQKCINAIAILIVVTCGIPILTFMLFVWLIKQLFQIQGIQMLSDRVFRLGRK